MSASQLSQSYRPLIVSSALRYKGSDSSPVNTRSSTWYRKIPTKRNPSCRAIIHVFSVQLRRSCWVKSCCNVSHHRVGASITPKTGCQACALTARGSITKTMKGMGGAAVGSVECHKQWTTASIPRSSGQGTPLWCGEGAQAARAAWGGSRYNTARGAMGTRPQQNRSCVAPTCQVCARTPGCCHFLRWRGTEEAIVPGA